MGTKKIADDLKKLMSKVRAGLHAQSNAKKSKGWKQSAKKKPANNPTDPMVLARSVIEAAIGEPLTPKKKKKTAPRKPK